MTQEQDQQAAEKFVKEEYPELYASLPPGAISLPQMHFLAGCQHVRADALNKSAAIVERKDREISALLQRVATLSNYDAGYQDGMASARAETQATVVMKDALLTKHEEVVIQLAAERAKAKALVEALEFISNPRDCPQCSMDEPAPEVPCYCDIWNPEYVATEALAKYAEDRGVEKEK